MSKDSVENTASESETPVVAEKVVVESLGGVLGILLASGFVKSAVKAFLTIVINNIDRIPLPPSVPESIRTLIKQGLQELLSNFDAIFKAVSSDMDSATKEAVKQHMPE